MRSRFIVVPVLNGGSTYTSRANFSGNVGRTLAQSPSTIDERFGYDAGMTGAGYSGTPLAQKLGISPGSAVAIVNAPRGFSLVKKKGKAPFDVAIVFPASRTVLKKAFLEATRAMKENGGVWIAWPKKSSGVETDVTEDVLREVLLPTGWVDNKVCAIDETYSGLRFVKRKELRKR
jgi:hypothetical protein